MEFDSEYRELKVYFDTDAWNTSLDGIIYTDKLFLQELREYFVAKDCSGGIDYSEAGMQADDYVSFDTDEVFASNYLGWIE